MTPTVTVRFTDSLDVVQRQWIARHMTRDGSDFQRAIQNCNLQGAGKIALVVEHGEIVSWTRSEMWTDPETQIDYMTLEAFTLPAHRRKGHVKLGAKALADDGWLVLNEPVAVFRDSMWEVAKGAACTDVTRFFCDEGKWTPCPAV
jgi:hypothetical protein